MKDWQIYVKYVGTISLCIPILFLFRYPITFILYVIGIFVNIFVNFIVKREEKTIPKYGAKLKKINKYPFYEYDLYAYPSEKNQNISYAVGFMVTYLAQNRNTLKTSDLHIVSLMILFFYLMVIGTSIILYMGDHNTSTSILTGHVLGLLLGVTFFKLSEPMIALNTI